VPRESRLLEDLDLYAGFAGQDRGAGSSRTGADDGDPCQSPFLVFSRPANARGYSGY
jgi:hypothetical protein